MMDVSSEEVVESELEGAKETVREYLARTGFLDGVLEGTHTVAVRGRIIRDLDASLDGAEAVILPVVTGG